MRRFRRLVEEGQSGVSGEQSVLSPYGLGSFRGLRDYELYAGISFELRGATRHAMKPLPPPEPESPVSPEAWRSLVLVPYEVLVPLGKEELAGSPEPYDFVFVGAHSTQGDELVRYDLRDAELEQAMQDGCHRLSFLAAAQPVSWTVWPYLRKGGWGEKFTRAIVG